MPTLVDWRALICHCLEISPEISDHDLSKAIEEVSEKVKEIDRLRAAAKKQQGPPRAQIVHRVECHKWRSDHKYFLDEPWVVESGPYDAHLRGSQPINNFELYLERNKEIVLIVYKDYECCDKPVKNPPRDQGEIGLGIDASFLLKGEEISLIAPELKEALAWIAEVALEGISHPDFNEANDDKKEAKILHPYIWYFHRRTEIHEEIDELPRATRLYVDCFSDYIESRMEDEWQSVKSLMKKGKISAQYMKYLIVSKPVISHSQRHAKDGRNLFAPTRTHSRCLGSRPNHHISRKQQHSRTADSVCRRRLALCETISRLVLGVSLDIYVGF